MSELEQKIDAYLLEREVMPGRWRPVRAFLEQFDAIEHAVVAFSGEGVGVYRIVGLRRIPETVQVGEQGADGTAGACTEPGSEP